MQKKKKKNLGRDFAVEERGNVCLARQESAVGVPGLRLRI
jgi:hypothetical protein